MKDYSNFNFESVQLRIEASHRGGGIEIDLSKMGYPEGTKMTAYQNYLGGGMLGAIGNDCNITNWQNVNDLLAIAKGLTQYFHSLTNHEDDEWEAATFEENQKRPFSAY